MKARYFLEYNPPWEVVIHDRKTREFWELKGFAPIMAPHLVHTLLEEEDSILALTLHEEHGWSFWILQNKEARVEVQKFYDITIGAVPDIILCRPWQLWSGEWIAEQYKERK